MIPLEQKFGICLMKSKQYTNIIQSFCGYLFCGRTGQDSTEDSWFQRKNLLRRLEPLLKMMFQHSTEILLNRKSGELVLDDELMGSREMMSRQRLSVIENLAKKSHFLMLWLVLILQFFMECIVVSRILVKLTISLNS